MTTLYTNLLLETIYEQAKQFPTKPTLVETRGKSITYAELTRSIDTLAANLVEQGFQKGDKALLLVRPGIRALQMLLAAIRAGGVVVVADLAMGQQVFEERMALAAPRWVLAEPLLLVLQRSQFLRGWLKKKGVEIPEMARLRELGCQIVNAGPKLPGLVQADLHLRDLQKPLKSQPERATLAPETDLLIIFTSGTTGNPKGVVHSQRGVVATANIVVEKLQLKPSDVMYSTNLHLLIPALLVGASGIIPVGKAGPAQTLANYQKFGVTKTFGVPVEFEAIADYCKSRQEKMPATLDTLLLGSAPVLAPFLERLLPVTSSGTAVWAIYGMTEMLPICMVEGRAKVEYAAQGGLGDLLGTPAEGVNLEIAADGEIVLEGPNLFSGYLGDAPLKRFATGDLGKLDEQGRLVLLGRKKDMIIRGSYNIYPGLLESSICRIPGVRDCALIGIYNLARSDEELLLVIEKEESAEADEEIFRAFLKKELLTGPNSIDLYAQPDKILFAKLPRAGRSQKVDKAALRQAAQADLLTTQENERGQERSA